MSNVFKKRFSRKNKNKKYSIFFVMSIISLGILLSLGYSIYRQRLTSMLAFTITKPVYTISLDNQSATTSGTTSIYQKYGVGYYLDSNLTNQMTTSSNGITIPTKDNYTFGGYYTDTNGSGTQYIDTNGRLTSSASTTHFVGDGTLYAKWTSSNHTVTLAVVNGTPTSGSKTVAHNGVTTFTVRPNTNYGGGTVSCTNSQTATLSGTTLTTGNITQDTTCTVTYQTGPSCDGTTCAYGESCKTGTSSYCSGGYEDVCTGGYQNVCTGGYSGGSTVWRLTGSNCRGCSNTGPFSTQSACQSSQNSQSDTCKSYCTCTSQSSGQTCLGWTSQCQGWTSQCQGWSTSTYKYCG